MSTQSPGSLADTDGVRGGGGGGRSNPLPAPRFEISYENEIGPSETKLFRFHWLFKTWKKKQINEHHTFIHVYPLSRNLGSTPAAAYIQVHFRLYFIMEANTTNPDQTAPSLGQSDLGPEFAINTT